MPSKHGARSSVSTDKLYSFPRVAAALLFAAALLIIQYRHSPFITKATTHEPQAYTELYFNNPTKLPSIASSREILPLSFSIHNLEGHAVAYTYRIDFVADNGSKSFLQQRTVSLAENHSVSVSNDNVKLPRFNGRAEISVVLIGHPESIHFWVESES